MNILKYIPRWLKNKYTVVTLVFLLFMLFLDNRNVFYQYNLYTELKNLEKSDRDLTIVNKKLEQANRKLTPDNSGVTVNHAEIERIAREKYHMKRKNEVVFLFPDSKPTAN